MLHPIMDPKRPPAERKLVPPPSGSAAMRLPGAPPDLRDRPDPPLYIDERLVQPETREELVNGRRVYALPANPEHGDRHTELDRVIGTYRAEGYVASTDLLTHADPHSDFATDTSIRRAGINPDTGDRYLEELAFEVVNEQSVADMIDRAKRLTTCGVRRIFAIFVKKNEISEWSPEQARFLALDLDGTLEDPTLVRPLPVRALLDAAVADDALVDALEAKGNPRLAEKVAKGRTEGLAKGRTEGLAKGRTEGLAKGRTEGLTKGIETACALLDIPLGPRERARLEDLDDTGLSGLLTYLETERRWPSTWPST